MLKPQTRRSRKSDKPNFSQSDTRSLFKPFTAQICMLVCLHLGDTFFCKGRKFKETNLKRSCLGALYMANFNSIQNHCRFKIAEAREKIFELSEEHLGCLLPSAPTRSALQPTQSPLCRYNPGTPFELARMLCLDDGPHHLRRRI
jgi:hypothetical protein